MINKISCPNCGGTCFDIKINNLKQYGYLKKECQICKEIFEIQFESAKYGKKRKLSSSSESPSSPSSPEFSFKLWCSKNVTIFGSIILIVLVIFLQKSGISICNFFSSSPRLSLRDQIASLKQEFPSQINESWKTICSALDENDGSTKTLLLLHGEDKTTCNCLKNRLASIYKKKENDFSKYPVFETHENAIDYGNVLERYRPLIKEHKILIIDLNKVSGSIARMFHFLCDEKYSDGNPALLIFTLRDVSSKENPKPMSRAREILEKSWNELLEYEINPLLSRIVKNVIFVETEKKNFHCIA